MSYSSLPKGSPVHIQAHAHSVEIWFSSPTGDMTDSHIFTMPCASAHQAHDIAQNWAKTWGMTWFTKEGFKHYPNMTYLFPELV